MVLNLRQFFNRDFHDNPEPPKFSTGSTVYDESGRRGVVSAQHVDRQHVNVQWKPGNVGVHHVDELHG